MLSAPCGLLYFRLNINLSRLWFVSKAVKNNVIAKLIQCLTAIPYAKPHCGQTFFR